ncbi:MAG TPA: cytochrome P450 [Burkholderiaceae bacterium]|jgi:cytochrome P450|nr:cytochrome P450 [Burkholderiaceae bacterium]
MPDCAPGAAIAQSFQLSRLPEDFYADPYPHYAALREHDPVRVLDNGSLFLTRYDDVSAVYRSDAASSDKKVEFKPKFGDSPLYEHHTTSLVFNDPPLHTRVRRLLMGAVSQRAIARMEAGVAALVDSLLDAMADKRRVDLIDDFAAAIPVEVIGNLLAFPREDRGPLRGWSLAILAALEPVPTSEMRERGDRAVTEFVDYLKRLIADRRRNPLDPDEDVLTRLIQGEVGGERLSELELLHNCIFLLNAGHETTTNLIGNGMHALLRFPPQCRRLRDDPSLIGPAVEEMLRYESPLQFNNRVLTGALEIGGRRFEARTFITMCIGAANRDPAQFPEPDSFDVARKPNRHLAFGHGDHACLGMNVARMEGRIAVSRLLARFRTLEPDGEPQRDLRVRFRGFRHLPVRVAS